MKSVCFVVVKTINNKWFGKKKVHCRRESMKYIILAILLLAIVVETMGYGIEDADIAT